MQQQYGRCWRMWTIKTEQLWSVKDKNDVRSERKNISERKGMMVC